MADKTNGITPERSVPQTGDTASGITPESDVPQTGDTAGSVKVDIMIMLITELSFATLPFVIIAVVYAYAGKFSEIWGIREWAFAATILSGQTLTKFVYGIISNYKFRAPRVVFIVNGIFFLGITPSFVVLLLILVEEIKNPQTGLPTGLVIAQLSLFAFSIVLFIVLGGAAELNRLRKENIDKSAG